MPSPVTRRALLRRGVVAAALLLAGCNVAGPPITAGPRPGEGRLVLYLNGPAAAPLEVTFELSSIGAQIEEGLPVTVRTTPLRVNSMEVVERQVLLAEAFLPQGRYRKLLLGIARARMRQEGKWVDLSVPTEGAVLEADIEIRRGEATTLFMTWDVGRAIEGEAFFRPAFALEGRGQELRRVLAYVTNEGSDTLSVIDRSLDRVVAVLAVGRSPRGIAISRDTTRAFVVNSRDNTLAVVDITSNRVIHTTNLELGAGASDIVVTPDGRTLYVSNTQLNSVSAIDAQNFQTLRTVPVGVRPGALVLIPPRAGLLVANGGSNTLSLLDTSRNVVAATIAVDFQPSNLAVDASGSQAFVPHLGSPRLSVVSLSSLRSVKTVTVGVGAAVVPEGEVGGSRLLVARPREGRVALVDVGLNAEVDSIAVGEEPRYMALEPDREKLYVVNRGSDTVSVVDRFSRRVRATIEVGKRPYAIAIVP